MFLDITYTDFLGNNNRKIILVDEQGSKERNAVCQYDYYTANNRKFVYLANKYSYELDIFNLNIDEFMNWLDKVTDDSVR